MCGICCIVLFGSADYKPSDTTDIADVPSPWLPKLQHRGPDYSGCCRLRVDGGAVLLFRTMVLHMRGDVMVKQPMQDSSGNVLLWNGEIFDGFSVEDTASDTTVLFSELQKCYTDDEVLAIFQAIRGPWAVVYYQVMSKKLWYGRDRFGRRSLLFHYPVDDDSHFVLTSVACQPKHSSQTTFEELPADGMYCLDLGKCCVNDRASFFTSLRLFPWSDASHNHLGDNLLLATEMPAICHVLLSPVAALNTRAPAEGDLSYIASVVSSLQELNSGDLYDIIDDVFRETASRFIDVLSESVRKRVHLLNRNKQTGISVQNDQSTNSDICDVQLLQNKFCFRCQNLLGGKELCPATVAVLFSGGIDSTVIAVLADCFVPASEPIDLLNVAFEQASNVDARKSAETRDKFDVPDRLTGRLAVEELRAISPRRQWNFIEIDVTKEELKEKRMSDISNLVYPLQTVLDDSIGCASWFAARGKACDVAGACYHSTARVVLVGMGADEQLGGYSRHRSKFLDKGWIGLIDEVDMEVKRISSRNLGRDDRVICDHAKEARFPFLDEDVVSFLNQLPMWHKMMLSLPRGLGDKLLLRIAADKLGLKRVCRFPKRAIQFGSRIAKLENSKEKAVDKHGISVLLAAIWEGHTDCVRFLIAKGAKREGKAPDGTSYLDCAEKQEIKDLLK